MPPVTDHRGGLEAGSSYVILEERCERSFGIFRDLVLAGSPGLCITRELPLKVQARYGLERQPVLWLSRNLEGEDVLRPTPAEGVSLAIEHFVAGVQSGVVVLDGLEYLVGHNDFRSILALVNDLTEIVAIHGAILLIPVNPKALDPQEVALLCRSLAQLPGAPVGVPSPVPAL